MTTTITDFFDRHNAWDEIRTWATNCRDMDHIWDTAMPDWLVWIATRHDVLDPNTVRRFAVHCARRVQPIGADPRSITAIDVAERYSNGRATEEELRAAEIAAYEVVSEAKSQDSRLIALTAAHTACLVSPWDAAWGASTSAVEATGLFGFAGLRDAFSNERTRQAEWLRNNTTPSWRQ